MSIKIMSMVFEKYHAGGGEMLLALAIADHAHDDGTHIFPSVKNLALKTRQSERTVQYQLRKMESDGWLILVDCEFGGRSKTREYKINDDWLMGADFAPIKKGATGNIKGAIAVAPESSITIIEPSGTVKESLAQKILQPPDLLYGVTEQTKSDFKKLRIAKRAPITERAISAIRDEATKAGISLETALIECCARGWTGFKAEWYLKTHDPPKATNKADALLQKNRIATQNWRPPEMRVAK